MGNMLTGKYACINPECHSSDARRRYQDGTSFCFSCQKFFPAQEGEKLVDAEPRAQGSFKKALSLDEINGYPIRGFKERGITKTVAEFFGVRASYDDAGDRKSVV